MLLQQRVRLGKLEKVRFADRMVPHISWTGSFQLEDHRPMVRSDVTDELFHLGRTFVGALLVVVVVVVVDEI